eukprot:4959489-Pleurochrysis_carterae.AAC.2
MLGLLSALRARSDVVFIDAWPEQYAACAALHAALKRTVRTEQRSHKLKEVSQPVMASGSRQNSTPG